MQSFQNYAGFSKLNRQQRAQFLKENIPLIRLPNGVLESFLPAEEAKQQLFEGMIENYLTNFPVPMGVVPNLMINGERFFVPYATEESSVVAAAAKAAKYWASRGGFKARIQSLTKKGQVHFIWEGAPVSLISHFEEMTIQLLHETAHLTAQMRKRGGGITGMELIDRSKELKGYFILDCSFETADSMGANFINSCLEAMAERLPKLPFFRQTGQQPEVIMAILSNFTPDCKVTCWVECPISEVGGWVSGIHSDEFVRKFRLATEIANLEVSRAVTHNKGIFNGIDAVLLATGNDTRATAASAHAWASKDGKYRSLTELKLSQDLFHYELELPMAIGTVGGITQIHPLVKYNMELLNHPKVTQLMMIAAAAGLANNFAAIASLITTGIQKGHMRMHLQNILQQLQVSEAEKEAVISSFKEKTVSYAAVAELVKTYRFNQEIKNQ